jgi:glycosyltransferase involved in cell wall biosynthesis
MRILVVVDKIPSAIYTLALPLQQKLKHLDIRILPVHPKRADTDTLYQAQGLMEWADLIDIHYWKSGEVLRTTFPVEFEKKPKILFHYNPYDVNKMNWFDYYKTAVVGNSDMQIALGGSYLVPFGIDLDFWQYQEKYETDGVVEMTVGRIESKKGILEVATVCEKLGYKLLLVGRVSEPDYMREILKNKCVEFIEDAKDEELRDAYYRSSIHVCNSTDNFESGTLPILEAMACGVPVLTRPVGHVMDLYNGENMVVRNGAKDDLEDLENSIKDLMESRPIRERIRPKAWETVKTRSHDVMARRINRLYYQTVAENKRWVSVIVPTFDRPDTLLKTLLAINDQTYPNIEMVVVDSGNISVEPLIIALRKEVKRPIKYERFNHNGEYSLPKARNIGVQKSSGEVLVFCDDRLQMEKDAVEIFEEKARVKTWLWGSKDNSEKGFVENFSCVLRSELISGGMFCERVNVYGGQTQEVRSRFENNGMAFELVSKAKATSSLKSSKASRRNDVIKAKFILQELYE